MAPVFSATDCFFSLDAVSVLATSVCLLPKADFCYAVFSAAFTEAVLAGAATLVVGVCFFATSAEEVAVFYLLSAML